MGQNIAPEYHMCKSNCTNYSRSKLAVSCVAGCAIDCTTRGQLGLQERACRMSSPACTIAHMQLCETVGFWP